MSDISSILSQNGISFDPNSVAAFGTAATDFSNQQTLSQQMAAAPSSTTQPAIPTLPTPSTPGVWQSIRYASDLINYAPKYRFIFKVKFIFNSPYSSDINQEFMYVVKEVDKPKVTFEYEDVNMYNFKTKVLKSIKHEPLNISFHDDIQNKVSDFFNAYRMAYSPSANLTTTQFKTMEGAGMSFTTPGTSGGVYSASMGILAGSNVHILNHIEIVQVYAHGTRQNTFVFVNPRIESFDFDNLSHESSEGNGLSCTFSYDSLYMQDSVVTGTPEYSWGVTDIIGSTESTTPVQMGHNLMGDGSSSGAPSPYTFNSTVANTFPNLGTNVVSSAGAGTGGNFTAATLASATPTINQATTGLSNSYGFSVSSDSAQQAASSAIDNAPSIDTSLYSMA